MPVRSTEQLLDQAHALSADQATLESDARWKLITELQRRPEEAVFERCRCWSVGALAFERRLAAELLGQLGFGENGFPFRSRSLPVLQQLLLDGEARVLSSALIALGHVGSRECVAGVVSLAQHPDADVRHGVVFALLGDESPEAVETLLSLSGDDDAEVRDWATFGLGAQLDLDSDAIREALLARVSDTEPDIRAEALAGLAKRGDVRVLAPLRAALASDAVGSVEVEAARDLGAPELLGRLEALRAWWDVDPALLEQAIARCRMP